MAGDASRTDVFINCPFDDEFAPTFRILIFNMPLELGLFLGAKRYGGTAQKAHRRKIASF